MFKGFGDFIQQAGKVREDMSRLQESLAAKTLEVSSGGGMVRVTANGKQEIIKIEIDQDVLDKGDKQLLQDLVAAGVNQAIKASQEMVREEVGKMAGNLGPLSALLQGMRA